MVIARPGAVGLLTGIEYSEMRDGAWHVPYPVVTTRIEVGLAE